MSNADSENAVVPFGSFPIEVVSGGGLSFFNVKEGFLLEEWSDNVLDQLHLETPGQVASWLLAVQGKISSGKFEWLLKEIVAQGRIGKYEVIQVYRSQSPDIREHSAYLTLYEMWNLFVGKGEERQHLFSMAELFEIGEQVLSVTPSDVGHMNNSWFAQAGYTWSLSFLTYWYEDSKKLHSAIKGKGLSLLAIDYYEKRVADDSINLSIWREMFFQEIKKEMIDLARTEPESHAYSRFHWLLAKIARDLGGAREKDLLDEVADALAEVVVTAISPYSSRPNLYHGKTLLYFFLTDPGVTREQRKRIRDKVNKSATAFAHLYFYLVDDALANK